MDRLEKLWRRFLKKNPDNDDFTRILAWSRSLKVKKMAAEELLKQSPTEPDLRCIINWVYDPALEEKATNLLKSKIFDKDKEKIIREIVFIEN